MSDACRLGHVCFLGCHGCFRLTEATAAQKCDARKHLALYRDYLKTNDWAKYKRERSKLWLKHSRAETEQSQ